MLLGAIATACFVVATALLARLHLLPTRLSPVPDAVSDYGTTSFHLHYRAMVVALGAGAILLAIGLARETDAVDLVWLWVYGAARIAIAAFMTDRPGVRPTTEGRIHWALAAAAFSSIAFGASDIDWTGAPGALQALGYAVAATAIATLVTRLAAPLRPVFGLAERALYVTSIAWLAIAAVDLAQGA
jgi:hypothetical protein